MLQVNNLCYDVTQNGVTKHILRDVSFRAPTGKLTIITGPNGSGKSTLAKILMGILTPTSGQILLDGKVITNMSITERAQLGMGYAFQTPTTFKGLTVKDLIDIASGTNNSALQACNYLSQVGLCAKDYIGRELDNKLSGGELKRIELALVLAKNSKINICDEPEAGIDLWSFDALVNLFKKGNATNIVISHQHRLIEIAHQVILLNAGQVQACGTYEQVAPMITQTACTRLGGKHE